MTVLEVHEFNADVVTLFFTKRLEVIHGDRYFHKFSTNFSILLKSHCELKSMLFSPVSNRVDNCYLQLS